MIAFFSFSLIVLATLFSFIIIITGTRISIHKNFYGTAVARKTIHGEYGSYPMTVRVDLMTENGFVISVIERTLLLEGDRIVSMRVLDEDNLDEMIKLALQKFVYIQDSKEQELRLKEKKYLDVQYLSSNFHKTLESWDLNEQEQELEKEPLEKKMQRGYKNTKGEQY